MKTKAKARRSKSSLVRNERKNSMTEDKTWWRKSDGTLCYGREEDCLHLETNRKNGKFDIVHNPNAKNCNFDAIAEIKALWKDPKTVMKLREET